MGKTYFKSLNQLSNYISDKINQLNNGELNNSEIEELTENTQELYERLVVIRHKTYEKYGKPTVQSVQEKPEVIQEIVQEVIETPEQSIEEMLEEVSPMMSFDFSEPIVEAKIPEVEIETVSDEKSHEPEESTLQKVDNSRVLNDSIAKETSSLNDSYKSSGSLADRLTSSKIDDLKSVIGINEKFAFITDLFSSSNENYNEAINALNNCNDGKEAKALLNEISINHNWDLDNKTVGSFIELIERRY